MPHAMTHEDADDLLFGEDDLSPDATPGSDTVANFTAAIKRRARALGFDICRIVPIDTAVHADFFDLWLDAGRAGEMTYLERHAEKRRNPQLLTPKGSEALRSVIVLAANYHQFDLPPQLRDDPSRGVIASYAWSDDYHEVLRPLLYELDAFIRSRTGRTTRGKCLVDTGPVLERDWAQRAGVGFTGKNCCTIRPGDGSWLLLATVMVPERLRYDTLPARPPSEPNPANIVAGLPAAGDYGSWEIPRQTASREAMEDTLTGTCGRCTRCLDACPTGAFIGPYHLDPLRCISYWTIESQTAIPYELRPLFRNRIFGCDICQEVCPWNRHLPERTPLLDGLRARQDRVAIPLLEGFHTQSPYWIDEDAFRARFRRSPILRARRHGMLRNVCVALGNWAAVDAIPALELAMCDPEPLARAHAAWACGRVAASHPNSGAVRYLRSARTEESAESVRAEMTRALMMAGAE